jgi:AAA-like domain
MTKAEIYTVGGTVQAGDGLYIPRQADDELLALCRAGTFAYVLSSRQMGKSSLMVRTVERLADEGSRCVSIDLNAVGVQVTPEQWYLGLLTIIESHLALQIDTIAWWQAHKHLGVTQRLTLFFQSVLLAEIGERVVIFIDEIDTTLSLPFTDDFYAAIRSLYNVRARESAFQRLAFVLIGVATPSDLISDPHRTPFNIGQRVDVTDFTFEEALPLANGLGLPPAEARQVLHWIMEWTGGHPYLTQRLCSVVALQSPVARTKADVDRTVASTFFGAMSEQDQNLQFVHDMLTKGAPTADRASVLLTYREIRLGFRPVRDEEQSVVKTHLKLSGVVRRDGALLRVRNLIYATVFDIAWIKEHLPANWTRAIYTVGGTVQAGDGLYIARKADKNLLGFCLTSDYAYVFGPPQTGKSSLMVHTIERLADEQIQAVVVSLGQLGLGEAATAETWYPRLLSVIADQLLLDTNVANWWRDRPHLSISQRLTSFFQEVVLVAVPASVVIFFDEVETTFGIPFAEDLYAAIGYLHRARAKVPLFRRLSFVLIGTAHQGDLIRDPQRTPLAIERQVDLTDWSEADALPLAEGLGLQADAARQVLKWVLDWTGGHPYLTQRLCQAITAQSRSDWSRADLDRLVAGTFFGEQSGQNHNLRSVDDILTAPTPNRAALLATYRAIRRGKRAVPDEEQSAIKARLKLSGVVRSENGVLRVRNPIYQKVFDNRWARAQLPCISSKIQGQPIVTDAALDPPQSCIIVSVTASS